MYVLLIVLMSNMDFTQTSYINMTFFNRYFSGIIFFAESTFCRGSIGLQKSVRNDLGPETGSPYLKSILWQDYREKRIQGWCGRDKGNSHIDISESLKNPKKRQMVKTIL